MLVEDALKGSGDGAAWGKDGLYFAGAGEEMVSF